MHNNYVVRKSFHTLIAGFILEVHCRSSRKEKVTNIHDISGGTVHEQLWETSESAPPAGDTNDETFTEAAMNESPVRKPTAKDETAS